MLHSSYVKRASQSYSSSVFLRALSSSGPNTTNAMTRMMSHSQIMPSTRLRYGVGTRRLSSSVQLSTTLI